MRFAAALFTFACLSACSTVPTQSEHALMRNDEWRQRQAQQDADAILRGMAQARQSQPELARSAR